MKVEVDVDVWMEVDVCTDSEAKAKVCNSPEAR